MRHPIKARPRHRNPSLAVPAFSAAILFSCALPKDEPPIRYRPPDCSDMGMTLEQLDRCEAARESYPPLYSVTPLAELPPAPSQDAGAPERKAAIAPGCLENMSRVGPFCIDQYEAYVVEISRSGESVHPFNEPLGQGGDTRYEARSAPSVYPQAHISGTQAEEACRNSGKRLCTLMEWKSACMGSQGLRYPYGNEPDAAKCNTGKRWGPGLLFGKGPFDLNDPRLNTVEGGLARTGEYKECQSDHRVFDMVGNLHEWVSDRVTQEMVGSGRTNIPGLYVVAGNGMFLGGFYSLEPSCSYRITAHPFSHYDYSTGFRCCMDPKK